MGRETEFTLYSTVTVMSDTNEVNTNSAVRDLADALKPNRSLKKLELNIIFEINLPGQPWEKREHVLSLVLSSATRHWTSCGYLMARGSSLQRNLQQWTLV